MNPLTRYTLIVSGYALVGLGVVGIFVPLLPTTPFLLLAAACFVRSSDRHYQWLMANRVFGPIIRDYQQNRAIAARTKVIAVGVLWVSLGYSMYRVQQPVVKWSIPCMGVVMSAMVLRIKTLGRSASGKTGN